MKIKKIIASVLAVASIMSLSACSDKTENEETKAPTQGVENSIPSDGDVKGTKVTFEVENYGRFVVETAPNHAPQTAAHFLELVGEGYYDGMKIGEVVPGLKIQTEEENAEPSADSSGASKETVVGEFEKNGITNDLKLEKYVLALNYTRGEFNTGNAQFMIMLGDTHGLDDWFAGFAKVVEGTEVIDKIVSAQVDSENVPVSPIVMKKVYINE